MKWEKIETAPKDGTVVALWADICYPVIGWYDPSKGLWQEVWTHEWHVPRQPSHWIKLPEPPK